MKKRSANCIENSKKKRSANCIENSKRRIFKMSRNDNNGLSHTKWNNQYHIVLAPKYRRKIFCGKREKQ